MFNSLKVPKIHRIGVASVDLTVADRVQTLLYF